MVSSDLSLFVYDPLTLSRLGMLASWLSLVWEEEYRGVGLLQLEVYETQALAALLGEGRYVGLSGSDTLMRIHTVRVRDKKLIVTGQSALGALSLRALRGEIPAGTAAESAIRDIVSDMEPFPCLSLGAEAGLEETTTDDIAATDVLSLAAAAAEQIDAGLRVRHDRQQRALLLEVYKPAQSVTRYSPLYGNLAGYARTLSSLSYRNVALVEGAEEEDGTRKSVYVGDTESAGLDRREMYVDASDLWREAEETEEEYLARLKKRGEEALLSAAMTDTLTLQVADGDAQLGELLPVYIPALTIHATVRITGVHITAQRGQMKRELVCGTPTITRRL